MATHPIESFALTPDDAFRTHFYWDDSTFGLQVWLYQDNSFNVWKEARAAESEEERTTKETGYMDEYSDYTIRMRCNITSVNGVSANANYGCCLRDKTNDGGGYCMTKASNGSSVNTYFLDEANDWA